MRASAKRALSLGKEIYRRFTENHAIDGKILMRKDLLSNVRISRAKEDMDRGQLRT